MSQPSSTSILWAEAVTLPSFAPLGGTISADVAIVGGGITGMTAALLLQRAGKKVAVIDAHRLGGGETGRTTAHLTALLDTRYHVLESKFGADGARAAAESSRAAIDRIEAFASELEPDCGFARLPGYLYAETEDQQGELEKELAALVRAGLDAGVVDAFPFPMAARLAVRIEGQARVHPLRYLNGLIARLVDAGGQIFERTRMVEVEDGRPCRVTTEHGTIIASEVLVATNQPVSSRFALHTKIAAYRSYAVATPIGQSFPDGLFWDMQDPYHYTRVEPSPTGAFLIVGGEDHKTGQDPDTQQRFARLQTYLDRLVPDARITHRWSGQIVEPADGLPFIGHNPGDKHVLVATGYSGNGMTFGTLAAMILADEVQGIENPWAALYRASRIKPLAQAREFISENVDFPAYLARDRLGPGQVSDPTEIPRAEGRLLRAHGKMLAVYRDDSDVLHVHSAVCPHLGCNVRWNTAERTWDCPCHGSRFDTRGCVLNGPATKDLEPASFPEAGAAVLLPST